MVYSIWKKKRKEEKSIRVIQQSFDVDRSVAFIISSIVLLLIKKHICYNQMYYESRYLLHTRIESHSAYLPDRMELSSDRMCIALHGTESLKRWCLLHSYSLTYVL